MTALDEIATRVATWVPADLPAEPIPEWVLFVRATVAAAGPRTKAEARNALRWCAGLVQAALANNMPLRAETLFAPECVDAYVASLGVVKGTADAMGSTLKRQQPGVGFAGTIRAPAKTASRAQAAGVVAVERPRVVLSADVAAEIDRFIPTLLPANLWAQIAGVTRSVVRAATPDSPLRANTWSRDVAYFAAWLHSEHRVLVPSAMLKAATIEEFLGVLLKHGRAERSVASYAANLHAIRDAHGIPLDVARRQFPKATAKEPYNAAEVAVLYEQARRIPSKGRRQFVTTSLDLMFGVGAKPSEVAYATPDDVTKNAAGVTVVKLPGRLVPALPAYAASIWSAAVQARATGASFMIGGLTTNRPNRLSEIFRGKNDRWQVHADSRRARATWLVDIAAHPGHSAGLPGLLEMAGLTTMQRFDELIEHIAARQLELSDTSFLAGTGAPFDATTEVAS